jgi:hypothetical protein
MVFITRQFDASGFWVCAGERLTFCIASASNVSVSAASLRERLSKLPVFQAQPQVIMANFCFSAVNK